MVISFRCLIRVKGPKAGETDVRQSLKGRSEARFFIQARRINRQLVEATRVRPDGVSCRVQLGIRA